MNITSVYLKVIIAYMQGFNISVCKSFPTCFRENNQINRILHTHLFFLNTKLVSVPRVPLHFLRSALYHVSPGNINVLPFTFVGKMLQFFLSVVTPRPNTKSDIVCWDGC
jgi:hypothetical protein